MIRPFEGIWVPIVTPFQDNQIDFAALTQLATQFAKLGIHGLVLGATTGEGAMLSIEERLQMLDCLRAALPADFPLVLGINGMDTATTAAQAKELAAQRPSALLVTAPPYVRPSQIGLQRHFETVAEAADTPIIVYDIPYRTGVNIDIETLQALSDDPRILGVKSCGASCDRLMRLIHDTPLKILIGEDSQFFPALAMGAEGAIAASAHYHPELWVRIYTLIRQEKLNAARTLATQLQTMIRALFAEPNPAPIKAWLASQGLIQNELRLPFVPAGEACLSQIQDVDRCLNKLQLW